MDSVQWLHCDWTEIMNKLRIFVMQIRSFTSLCLKLAHKSQKEDATNAKDRRLVRTKRS